MTVIIETVAGADHRRPVDVQDIVIPDLRRIANTLAEDEGRMVLDTWHLANDMLTRLGGNYRK